MQGARSSGRRRQASHRGGPGSCSGPADRSHEAVLAPRLVRHGGLRRDPSGLLRGSGGDHASGPQRPVQTHGRAAAAARRGGDREPEPRGLPQELHRGGSVRGRRRTGRPLPAPRQTAGRRGHGLSRPRQGDPDAVS